MKKDLLRFFIAAIATLIVFVIGYKIIEYSYWSIYVQLIGTMFEVGSIIGMLALVVWFSSWLAEKIGQKTKGGSSILCTIIAGMLGAGVFLLLLWFGIFISLILSGVV